MEFKNQPSKQDFLDLQRVTSKNKNVTEKSQKSYLLHHSCIDYITFLSALRSDTNTKIQTFIQTHTPPATNPARVPVS